MIMKSGSKVCFLMVLESNTAPTPLRSSSYKKSNVKITIFSFIDFTFLTNLSKDLYLHIMQSQLFVKVDDT